MTKAAKKRADYERRDVPAGKVAYAIGGLVGLMVLSVGLVAGLLHVLPQQPDQSPVSVLETHQQPPPTPRLQMDPAQDRLRIDAIAQEKLNGYDWSDKAAGKARLPIDRAMQITAQRGWPDAASKAATEAAPR